MTIDRDPEYISIKPSVQFGEECLGDTRVPVSAIVDFWWGSDMTEERICKGWSVTPKAIRIACWYWASYRGGTKIGRAWREWALQWHHAMWSLEYDRVPLPPRQSELVNDA